MHPSEWAKMIQEKRARKDIWLLLLAFALVGLGIALGAIIKSLP